MLRIHRQIRSSAVRAISMALALTAGMADTHAQSPIIAVGAPSFQSNDYPSFETDLLQRIAVTGDVQPDDLARLTRLMTLESVSMLADIHADMPGTTTGNRLEGQIRQLWDATEVMSENVGTAPLDARALARVQDKYNDVEIAFRQIDSTLGAQPGISNRASAHLRDLSRLTAATNSVMRVFEADLPAPARRASGRQPQNEMLRRQARVLSNDVVQLAANVKKSKQPDPRWDAVSRDLTELFVSIEDFERMLSAQSSVEQIQSTVREIRRRASRAEARITQLGWPTDLVRTWQGMRERMNEINDEVGLPRVINRSAAVRPGDVTAKVSTKKPSVRVYRGTE